MRQNGARIGWVIIVIYHNRILMVLNMEIFVCIVVVVGVKMLGVVVYRLEVGVLLI